MTVQIIDSNKRLLEEINLKKEKLIKVAVGLELTDPRVLKCSQEIDELMNLFYKREKLHMNGQPSGKNRKKFEMRDIEWDC